MDNLFDRFKIKLLNRNDITARFSVANNRIVDENWLLVLATLTFYSVGLAETASDEEGFFTYLQKGEVQRKDLPSACRDFIEMFKDRTIKVINKTIDDFLEDSEDDEFYSRSADAIWSDWNDESFMTAHNIIAPLHRPGDDTVDLYPVRHNPPHAWPVGSYDEISSSAEAIGYTCSPKIGKVRPFTCDFNTGEFRFAEIIDIIGKWKDIPGNWGDHIRPGTTVEKVETPTTKTITLNLDQFTVRLKKLENDVFETRFTPIREVHHAASMLARKCTIKWGETKLYPISIMNKVTLRIIEQTSKSVIIETEYMALDCL